MTKQTSPSTTFKLTEPLSVEAWFRQPKGLLIPNPAAGLLLPDRTIRLARPADLIVMPSDHMLDA